MHHCDVIIYARVRRMAALKNYIAAKKANETKAHRQKLSTWDLVAVCFCCPNGLSRRVFITANDRFPRIVCLIRLALAFPGVAHVVYDRKFRQLIYPQTPLNR